MGIPLRQATYVDRAAGVVVHLTERGQNGRRSGTPPGGTEQNARDVTTTD